MTVGILKGKRGIVFGVANDKSICWGIAEMAAKMGAELAFSYQNEVLKSRVESLATSIGSNMVFECDVRNDESIDKIFTQIEEKWGSLDFIVYGPAFSDKNELRGKYYMTSRQNFLTSLDISCYSLTAITRRAISLMKDGGSIIALSYLGSERVVPNYNVMGVAKSALECSVRYLAEDVGENNIRVNTISAGPVRTLASSGIGDFRSILGYTEQNAPLRRNITLEDVAGTAVFLLSDLSSGITGEMIHVDSGYHSIAVPKQIID